MFFQLGISLVSLTPFLTQVFLVATAPVCRVAGESENSSWSPYAVLNTGGYFFNIFLGPIELTSTAIEQLESLVLKLQDILKIHFPASINKIIN